MLLVILLNILVLNSSAIAAVYDDDKDPRQAPQIDRRRFLLYNESRPLIKENNQHEWLSYDDIYDLGGYVRDRNRFKTSLLHTSPGSRFRTVYYSPTGPFPNQIEFEAMGGVIKGEMEWLPSESVSIKLHFPFSISREYFCYIRSQWIFKCFSAENTRKELIRIVIGFDKNRATYIPNLNELQKLRITNNALIFDMFVFAFIFDEMHRGKFEMRLKCAPVDAIILAMVAHMCSHVYATSTRDTPFGRVIAVDRNYIPLGSGDDNSGNRPPMTQPLPLTPAQSNDHNDYPALRSFLRPDSQRDLRYASGRPPLPPTASGRERQQEQQPAARSTGKPSTLRPAAVPFFPSTSSQSRSNFAALSAAPTLPSGLHGQPSIISPLKPSQPFLPHPMLGSPSTRDDSSIEFNQPSGKTDGPRSRKKSSLDLGPTGVELMAMSDNHFKTSDNDVYSFRGSTAHPDRLYAEFLGANLDYSDRVPQKIFAYSSLRFYVGLQIGLAASMQGPYRAHMTGEMRWLPAQFELLQDGSELHAIEILLNNLGKSQRTERFLCRWNFYPVDANVANNFACYISIPEQRVPLLVGLILVDSKRPGVATYQPSRNPELDLPVSRQVVYDMTVTAYAYWHQLASHLME